VDDLIRSTIQEALAVEQPPRGLRARVIGAVPMATRPPRQPRVRSFQWAAGVVAIVLAVAVIAEVIYARNTSAPNFGSAHPASGARLVSPEGIAVGPDGSVYVSDYVTNRVFRLQADGTLVVVAGGGLGGDGAATKANLAHPAGLAFDRQGRLYIADNLGGVIRRIDPPGTISTFVSFGTGTTALNGPLGLAFDRLGALYIGDFGGELLKVEPSGGGSSLVSSLDTSALAPPALYPGYLAFDAAGNLYVADRAPVPGGGIYAPGPGGGCRIVRMAPDHKLSVVAGTGTCGFSGDNGPASKAQLNDPNGIAFDSAGNLYFSDSNNHRIRRIDARGIITTVAGTGAIGHSGDGGPASRATFGYPFGLAIGNGDLLYVSDAPCQCMGTDKSGRVRLIRLSDGIITTVASGQSRVVTPP
jgi:sugar lactone lactonase YvrE